MTKRDLINLLEVKKDNYANTKKNAFNDMNAINVVYYSGAIDALEYALVLIKDLKGDPTEDNSYLEEDIAVLGLSNRTQNNLKRNNINTLGDLTKHTRFSLLRLKGVGDESVKEIIVRCVALKIPLGSGLWHTTKKRKKVVEDDEYKKYIVESVENDICNDSEFEQKANKIYGERSK